MDDKIQPGVQSMKLHVDLTYGYIKASIVKFRVDPNYQGNMANATRFLIENETIITDELNPQLDRDALILERVDDNGKYTNFYLRTIITV